MRSVTKRLKNLIWLLALQLNFSCSDSSTTLSIATGGPAGLYYPIGGGMASIWSNYVQGINVRAEVTGGSVSNVIQVARGESDLGIAMADVISDAYNGEGLFPESLPLRVLLSAYPNVIHIVTVANTNIRSISDLVGKRVSLGAQGSGTAVAAQNLLTGLGLDRSDFSPRYLNFTETTAALKDGAIDAGFIVGGIGISAITDLSVSRPMRLISLSESESEMLVTNFPEYSRFSIPKGSYKDVEEDIETLGIWSAVIVHESMKEELVYRLVCSLYRNHDELRKISPAVEAMSFENMDRFNAVPLHSGAAQFKKNPTADCKVLSL